MVNNKVIKKLIKSNRNFFPKSLVGFGIFRTFAATTTIVEVFYKSHTPLLVKVGDFSYLCTGFYKNKEICVIQKKKSKPLIQR